MKIIKLVPLSRAIFPNVPKGPAESSNRESRRVTDWFVNVQSGTISRARLANLYKAAGPEKWISIAYVEGIKRQKRGRLSDTKCFSAKVVISSLS